MAKDENENAGGAEFELSAEELAKLSPEEQEIIRQQAEIMQAAADEKAENGPEGADSAEGLLGKEMAALAEELGVPADELAALSPEEREIVLQQAKIMGKPDEEPTEEEATIDAAVDGDAEVSAEGAGATDGPDEPAEAAPSDEQMSLMEVIAMQKSGLQANGGDDQASGTAAQEEESAGQADDPSGPASAAGEGNEQPAEGQATDSDTAAADSSDEASQSDGLTLQDIIAKQKASLSADGPADQSDNQPQGESDAEEAPAADEPTGTQDSAAGKEQPAIADGAGVVGKRRISRLSKMRVLSIWLSRLSMMHILLMLNGVIVLMVIGVFFSMHNRPQKAVASVAGSVAELPSPVVEPDNIDTNVEIEAGLTWQMAEGTYRGGDYITALAQFRHLLQASQVNEEWVFFADFFRLRTALCLINLGQSGTAQGELAGVLASRSPVLRAVANYHAGMVDLQAGRFMRARTRGYMALASLGGMRRQMAMARDVDFMIARALTERALSFHPIDVAIVWTDDWTDPFEDLDDVELTALLKDGMGREGEAGLGAVVNRVKDNQVGSRWSVTCQGSELQSLLQRFSAASRIVVRWESVDPKARQRSVTLAVWAVSANRLVEIACGSTGLMARFTGEEVVIYDPFAGDSLQQQRDLIVREGMSVWRRLFLRNPDDARLAAGYYALACLYECSGDLAAAMREHLINYRRFPKHRVAPESLLRSARLRIELLDYAGARNDLLELLNTYPDTDAIEEIYQFLGDATAESGLWDEAIHAYSKLYFLGLSDASRRAASFGAGRCYFANGAHEEADKWLVRYIEIADASSENHLAEAYYLLGRAKQVLGFMDEATAAQYCALSAKPDLKLRADIVLAVASLEADRDELVKVAGVLESLNIRRLTGEQALEYLLLYSRVHRAMGITERALTFLDNNGDMVTDPQQRARIDVELARCYAEMNELGTARRLLSEALLHMSPGPEAQVTALELAEACLKVGDADGAIAVADRVARIDTSDEVHRRARNVLGGAYLMNQNYNEAAQVLSGLSPRYNTGGGNDSSDR